MKIICIGRNYTDHVKEMESDLPKTPLFFMKPDTALLLKNRPFFIPEFSNEIHHEVEVIVRICKMGKHIQSKFAHKYYHEIGLGVDFTARNIQRDCINHGNPWEIAKSFDYSAVVSEFISLENFDIQDIPFHLEINGKTVQESNTRNMIFKVNEIIAHVSKYVTLRIGDLIYTGTPAGVGKVNIGDNLKGYIADKEMFGFEIK